MCWGTSFRQTCCASIEMLRASLKASVRSRYRSTEPDGVVMGPTANDYVRQGDALAAQSKFEDAVGSYRQALRLQPDSFAAHFQLGNLLSVLGKGPEAVAAYLQALRLQPDHADALAGLGLDLAKQGSL